MYDDWQGEAFFDMPDDQRELIATIIKALPDEQRGSFAAVIEHSFLKKGKGKGKGKKGGTGDETRLSGKGPGPENKCHECGSEQHFKRDCPVHIAKMEFKGKGKGKCGA